MNIETLQLAGTSPGLTHSLRVLRFGTPGHGPKAMIQAALHADEVPAMLVAQALRERLCALDAAGQLLGEVVLVPCANPLGLAQQVLGQHVGRFDLRDGVNFNRQVPDVSATVSAAVQGRLGDDAAANVACMRDELRRATAALSADHPVDDLKLQLLRLAIDADIVLDLHCDAEATLHLYGLTPQAGLCAELGALLGAEAILLATESGDSPFDEACSRPWFVVQQAHPAHPVPLACFSTTVELRGAADTSHALAAQDADALVEFLRRRGVVAGVPAPLPAARCQPTPLAASEPVRAPGCGVIVFQQALGAQVEAGAVVADLVDLETGQRHSLRALSSGVLYARCDTRWATPGERVAKIAGTTLARTGKLLGP
ncbi:MAG: deacylase [Leptothrix sp. (in: Bacteria)]|nr:deacylase [Leptothrix sp. (in: b-proteobacteria)]